MWQQQLLQRCRYRQLAGVVGCITVLTVAPMSGMAATTDHTTTVAITDEVAPTAPVNLVVAVRGETVDLNWDPGTDDQGIHQYLVRLDGVIVARTSNLEAQFEISGSGTYEATVQSEDFGGNVSSSSPITFDVSRSGGGGGSRSDSAVSDTSVSVVAGDGFVRLQINVPTASALELAYGTTPDYELGEVVVTDVRQEHEIVLPDLTPGVRYYYVIRPISRSVDDYIGSFVAGLQTTGTSQTSRVSFDEVTQQLQVELGSAITSYVVVQNQNRPPLHRFDGQLLYRGSASTPSWREAGSGFWGIFFLDADENVVQAVVLSVSSQSAELIPVDPRVQGLGWQTDIVVTQGIERLAQADLQTVHAGVPLTIQYPISEASNVDGGIVLVRPLGSRNFANAAILTRQQATKMWHANIMLPSMPGAYELVVAFYQGDEVTTLYSTPLTLISLASFDVETKSARAFLRMVLLQIITLFQSFVTN